MKKILISIITAVLIIACKTPEQNINGENPAAYNYIDKINMNAQSAASTLPFTRGVNFTQWFEAQSPRGINFTTYTEQDFINAKSIGVEVIRLPIRLHSMTGGAPDYRLDPLLLRLLDQAVDWAEKHQLYIILDNHSFDPRVSTTPEIENILVPVWKQMAAHYKNRSSYVLYEILNEPHGIAAKTWADIQGRTIAAIREIDKDRIIVVGGTNWNSIDELFNLQYPYDNLVYTFHFYDPYLFTHQGETWGGPPTLQNLRGVPFPADAHKIPAAPPDLRGTWVEESLRSSYRNDGTIKALERQLDKVVKFAVERDVPVFCGEFGVYIPNCLPEDRVRWYEIVNILFDLRGIVRTSWD
jgi:endoglucanase